MYYRKRERSLGSKFLTIILFFYIWKFHLCINLFKLALLISPPLALWFLMDMNLPFWLVVNYIGEVIRFVCLYRFQELVRSDKLQALDYLHSGFSHLTNTNSLEIEEQVFFELLLYSCVSRYLLYKQLMF